MHGETIKLKKYMYLDNGQIPKERRLCQWASHNRKRPIVLKKEYGRRRQKSRGKENKRRKISAGRRTREHKQAPINLDGHSVVYKLTFVYGYKKNHVEGNVKHRINLYLIEEFMFTINNICSGLNYFFWNKVAAFSTPQLGLQSLCRNLAIVRASADGNALVTLRPDIKCEIFLSQS